jgi:hypothetical protein
MIPDRFRGTLKPLSLVDLLQFLGALNRPGLLSVSAEGTAVGLYLRGARVVQATSSRAADRLGAILLRAGRITPEQHDEALRLAAGGETIGRALAAAAGLSPRELMEARLRQVRDIALSLFEWTAGEFAFIEGEEVPDPALEVDLPIPDLIAEGIRTLRTPALFAARLPAGGRVFAPIAETDRRTTLRLEPHEDLVLRLVDGERDIAGIAALSEFSDLEARRILFLLSALGYLKTRPRAGDQDDGPPSEEVEELVERYNAMFVRVHEHLMEEVGPISTDLLVKSLREIESVHPVLFGGATLGGDGSVDVAQIRDNVGRLEGRGRREILVQGLNELLYAELLVVRRTLGPEHEGRLLRVFRGAGAGSVAGPAGAA